MPREQSTFYETYYVKNESAGHISIFRDTEDLNYFSSLVNEYAKKLNITIFAYCFRRFSYHMIIRALRGNFADIADFIKRVCALYTRFFNDKSFKVFSWERYGLLFAAKYVSVPINSADALKRTTVEIHKSAGIDLIKLENYPYCSYGKYLCFLKDRQCGDDGIAVNMSYFKNSSAKEFIALHKDGTIQEDKRIDVHPGEYFFSYGFFVRKDS